MEGVKALLFKLEIMNTAIVLMQNDTNGSLAITQPKHVYSDWDWATLMCAAYNDKSTDSVYYYLLEVPFDKETEAPDFNISHSGSELKITDWDELEVYGEIKLVPDVYEELYHQECPPRTKPTYRIESVILCGTDVDKLKISEELKRQIQNEAEAYRDEMIDEIGEPYEY